MAEEYELSDYSNVQELQGCETKGGDTQSSERKFFRFGIITLAVLCVTQAALNVSLRLAFDSKEEIDQLSFSSSTIEELCRTDQSQQNTTQGCSSCCNMLRSLLRKYKKLETERDQLRSELSACTSENELTLSGDMPLDDEIPNLEGSSALFS